MRIREKILWFIAIALVAYTVHAQTSYAPENKSTTVTTSINPGLLLVGPSTATNFTITGVKLGMHCDADASDGTDMIGLGAIPMCTVISNDTVAFRLMVIVSLTPPAKTYTLTVHS